VSEELPQIRKGEAGDDFALGGDVLSELASVLRAVDQQVVDETQEKPHRSVEHRLPDDTLGEPRLENVAEGVEHSVSDDGFDERGAAHFVWKRKKK